MKQLKLPARMKALRRELFPTEAEQEADSQNAITELKVSLEAARIAVEEAKHEVASTLKQACADRLQPHIGRLMLVTNFKGFYEQQHASRIAQAVGANSVMGRAAMFGVSVHPMYERRNEPSEQTLLQTGLHVTAALQAETGAHAQQSVIDVYQSEEWLSTIVRAAEDTARGASGTVYGHIAVVGALDIRHTGQADIPGYVDPGTAFRLVNVGKDARLGWEITSFAADSEYVYEQAMAEDMIREFRDM